MALSFRNIRGDRPDIGLDPGNIEVWVCERACFEHRLTFLCSHGYVGTTFDGLTAVICGIHAATVAGFSANCDNALQSKKEREITICPKKGVNLLLSFN